MNDAVPKHVSSRQLPCPSGTVMEKKSRSLPSMRVRPVFLVCIVEWRVGHGSSTVTRPLAPSCHLYGGRHRSRASALYLTIRKARRGAA